MGALLFATAFLFLIPLIGGLYYIVPFGGETDPLEWDEQEGGE